MAKGKGKEVTNEFDNRRGKYASRRPRPRRYTVYLIRNGRRIEAARIEAKNLEEAVEKAYAFFGYVGEVEVVLGR